ncbi:unnamed protein product [Chrysoparadoxa australica]
MSAIGLSQSKAMKDELTELKAQLARTRGEVGNLSKMGAKFAPSRDQSFESASASASASLSLAGTSDEVMTSMMGANAAVLAAVGEMKQGSWKDEATGIAVKLIDEVKTLRWEREASRAKLAKERHSRVAAEARAEHLQELLDARTGAVAAERTRADGLAKELRACRDELRTATATATATATEPRGSATAAAAAAAAATASADREVYQLKAKISELEAGALKHEHAARVWAEAGKRFNQLKAEWEVKIRAVEEKGREAAKAVARSNQATDKIKALKQQKRQLRGQVHELSVERETLRGQLKAARAGQEREAALPLPPQQQAIALEAGAGAGVGARTNVRPRHQQQVAGHRSYCRCGVSSMHDVEQVELELDNARAQLKLTQLQVAQEQIKQQASEKETQEATRQLNQLMATVKRVLLHRQDALPSNTGNEEVAMAALRQALR